MKNKDSNDQQHAVGSFKLPADKDTLSQADMTRGIGTVSEDNRPHAALETPDGKNNGAEPSVFENQRKAHT